MQTAAPFREQLITDGFAMVPAVLKPESITKLISALETLGDSKSILKRGGIFAVRNLLDISPEILALAESEEIRRIVKNVLGEEARPVRGILFDKTPEANWKVPWHQDVTIAVAEKRDVEGFGPWSVKAGVLHVQPPAGVLENMLSVRIHLDPSGAENGALRVLPGSHLLGRLPECEIAALLAERPAVHCAAARGDVLLMRPLLLHASSPSTTPGHRRVIHIDFAAINLQCGLRWAANELNQIGLP
jgi:ectoine hydroxylase-related dioxygenase (phytanoyl-CoA dioxygenase family)